MIPARNAERDIGPCVTAILRSSGPHDADVLVVDDRSTDGTAMAARAAGARVVGGDGQGPYTARNRGWRDAAGRDVVVFTDVRNRAEDHWLERLVEPFADPAVAITGGLVTIGGDARLAHRLARRESHVDPRPLLEDAFLPYVTTSSMAVRSSVLVALGGFRETRSGADADLCWRAQLHDLGRVVLAPESHMVCVPRGNVWLVWEQWRRYARSYVEVRNRFTADGAKCRMPISMRARLGHVAREVRAGGRRDLALELVDVVRWVGYELAYRRALRSYGCTPK